MAPIDIERSKAHHAELTSIRGCTQAHHPLWRALLSYRWSTALSLAQDQGYTGVRTARGLAHQLCDHYRSRGGAKRRVEALRDYISTMESEAESGRDLSTEFDELAQLWEVPNVAPSIKPTRRQKREVDERDKQIQRLRRQQERAQRKREREVKESGSGNGNGNGNGNGESTRATEPPARLTHAREDQSASGPEPRALERLIIAPASDPYARHQALIDLASDIARELPPPSLPDHPIGRQYTGVAAPETRAAWIDYVDQVARRWPGPLNAHDLARITGAPVRWTNKIVGEWKALLERGLTEDQRRSMALAMSAEAEAIAREALALVQSSGDERLKAAGLKLALDSLARRQSLIGADQISLQAPVEVSSGDWTEQAAAAGLSAEDLKDIGDIASRAMSRRDAEKNSKS